MSTSYVPSGLSTGTLTPDTVSSVCPIPAKPGYANAEISRELPFAERVGTGGSAFLHGHPQASRRVEVEGDGYGRVRGRGDRRRARERDRSVERPDAHRLGGRREQSFFAADQPRAHQVAAE